MSTRWEQVDLSHDSLEFHMWVNSDRKDCWNDIRIVGQNSTVDSCRLTRANFQFSPTSVSGSFLLADRLSGVMVTVPRQISEFGLNPCSILMQGTQSLLPDTV